MTNFNDLLPSVWHFLSLCMGRLLSVQLNLFSGLFPCHYNSSVFHCPASLYCLNICVCLHLDPALGKRWMGSRLRYAWAAVSYSSGCPVCTSVNWKFHNEEKIASGLILLVYMKQNPSSHRLCWSMIPLSWKQNFVWLWCFGCWNM